MRGTKGLLIGGFQVASMFGGFAPAAAAAGTDMTCNLAVNLTLSPGITLTSGSVTQQITGSGKVSNCSGRVAGVAANSKATNTTFTSHGTSNETCLQGHGMFAFSFEIPLASGGSADAQGAWKWSRSLVLQTIAGGKTTTPVGGQVSGHFLVAPTLTGGTCVTPVTHATLNSGDFRIAG